MENEKIKDLVDVLTARRMDDFKQTHPHFDEMPVLDQLQAQAECLLDAIKEVRTLV